MKDIQGVQRGKCNSCECEEFRASPDPRHLRCEYCNHTPGEHVKIVELGACQKCGQDDCDKYVSEDPNSYTDCQYCGCSASCHAGADALRKTQPKPPPTQSLVPMTQQRQPPVGATPIQAVSTGGPFPQTGGGIQPRAMPGGQAVQTPSFGTCSFPGCPYPRRVEGDRVHDYCSRTCAQKHNQMKSSFHQQKAVAAQQAANMGTGSQPPAHMGMGSQPPAHMGMGPQPPPAQSQDPKYLVQAHQRTTVTKKPGSPAQASTVTVVSAQKLPDQSGPTNVSGMGPRPAFGQKLCAKCNTTPANPGRSWCQQCYLNG